MRPLALGPEGGRPGRPTQAVRHTCSGNFKIAPHKQKSIVKKFTFETCISKFTYLTFTVPQLYIQQPTIFQELSRRTLLNKKKKIVNIFSYLFIPIFQNVGIG
jgi:hypothetical protein